MILRRLKKFVSTRRCTLLGIGPMSRNCVDAAIGLSNRHEIPLMLIASRRQIDSEDFGGGYVNGWSTECFAEYVINLDKKGNVILARDHGGPWQSDVEKQEKFSLRRAMESAKKSYLADIESGFDIIHIDPSIDIHCDPSVDEVLQRIFELYEYCWNVAQRKQREILFEIGTEEQSGSTNTQEALEYVLSEMWKFCENYRLPLPSFVVIQTGTRVMETRNVGSFDCPVRIVDELPAEIQVPKMIDICNRYGIFVKEHNTDYLSNEALSWHPKLGIHSANVAPEFGVAETRAFVQLLSETGQDQLLDEFIELAYESGKWKKWMLPETVATDKDRAIIAGHYVFSDARFVDVKKKAQKKLKDILVDDYLKDRVEASILRYLKCFRLLGDR